MKKKLNKYINWYNCVILKKKTLNGSVLFISLQYISIR